MGYRQALKDAGFDIIDGTHPCVPIMLYDEHKAARMAQKLYELGIYAVSFTYPVVPKGRARIRTQVSAAHTKEDLEFAVRCLHRGPPPDGGGGTPRPKPTFLPHPYVKSPAAYRLPGSSYI
ncbi:MAG: aminotransferase class I/II-fold pyridoxal phosphate-dependent enzyme [Oscillospiraceae bacterium]